MQTTQTSIQVFSVGDYVRTSKGKIGVITKPQGYVVGYYDSQQNFVQESFHQDQVTAKLLAGIHLMTTLLVPNQVKLGNKSYPIWSDKLQKLERLRIRTQQGFSQCSVDLPIADAKLLIDIYTRNNIWFSVI